MGERGENLVLTIIFFPSVENYTGQDRNAIFSRHLNASSFGFMFREIGASLLSCYSLKTYVYLYNGLFFEILMIKEIEIESSFLDSNFRAYLFICLDIGFGYWIWIL